MQIDSTISGYGYTGRPLIAERKPDDEAQRETENRRRANWGMTGSSTLLSSSLANALWAVEGNRERAPASRDNSGILQTTPSSLERVEDVYSEF